MSNSKAENIRGIEGVRDDLAARLLELDGRLQELASERARLAARLAEEEGEAAAMICEASETLRHLVERHDGSLPVFALEHVWRELAGAAVSDANIVIHCEECEETASLRDAIRYHFGFSLSVEEAGDAPDVVRNVSESAGDIGVIQLKERSDLPFWRSLGGAAPVIVARLPFLVSEERPADLPALVIAKPGQAVSGDMRAYDARWRGALPGPLMAGGIEVLAFHRTAEGVDALIGAPSDLAEDDVRMICAQAGAEPDTLRPVGIYASPIDVEDTGDGGFDD
ncbi:chorismate mutase [Stappia sp. F7233]|uniref:Chorismate mutase n=1 Tax=Stappia albiluteola TaxID=2758565 RepID=A0A839AG76_9HYPH|nr:chorismate mutase [Stappia albiluteola]MBA5778671.1 chorismate mutase [Stappia albiluteola]